jgi:hypothetical protein
VSQLPGDLLGGLAGGNRLARCGVPVMRNSA